MRSDRIESIGGGGRGTGMRIGSGRAASSARGSSKAAVKSALKNAKKTKPLAEPKSAVRVKPPAKTKGAPDNPAKAKEKEIRSVMRSWNPITGLEDGGPVTAGKSRLVRVAKSKNPSASGKASRPLPKKK